LLDHGPLAVAERSFAEPVRFEDIQAIEESGAWCLTVHAVEYIRSYFAIDRRRMLCLYTAPDVEAVRTRRCASSSSSPRLMAV
jgi:hypothetical protein